jgi:hypothetical protein
MSDIYAVKEKMHKMRAKLYPSYLPGTEGKYIARTANEASVSIEEICAAMKNRGGFDGSYEEAVKTMRHFFMEMMYQLADGFSVNLDYFTVHPNIGGTFKNPTEAHNHKDHPIDFRFQALAKLRALTKDIDVELEGIAETSAYIDLFIDQENEFINTQYAPESMFAIHGHKIKIAGAIDAGVYFVPVDAPQDAVQAERIAENTPSRITGITPSTGHAKNRIEIHTWYSGSDKTHLKASRVITSPFVLEEV